GLAEPRDGVREYPPIDDLSLDAQSCHGAIPPRAEGLHSAPGPTRRASAASGVAAGASGTRMDVRASRITRSTHGDRVQVERQAGSDRARPRRVTPGRSSRAAPHHLGQGWLPAAGPVRVPPRARLTAAP